MCPNMRLSSGTMFATMQEDSLPDSTTTYNPADDEIILEDQEGSLEDLLSTDSLFETSKCQQDKLPLLSKLFEPIDYPSEFFEPVSSTSTDFEDISPSCNTQLVVPLQELMDNLPLSQSDVIEGHEEKATKNKTLNLGENMSTSNSIQEEDMEIKNNLSQPMPDLATVVNIILDESSQQINPPLNLTLGDIVTHDPDLVHYTVEHINLGESSLQHHHFKESSLLSIGQEETTQLMNLDIYPMQMTINMLNTAVKHEGNELTNELIVSVPTTSSDLSLYTPEYGSSIELSSDSLGYELYNDETLSPLNNISSPGGSNDDFNEEFLYSKLSACSNDFSIEHIKDLFGKSCLPDGQNDLNALLVAARIDMSIDELVKPNLFNVKRALASKQLKEWQKQLCLKIRRRKKNTAAVRSSRRKRNQYVVQLRTKVEEMKDKHDEAVMVNSLLHQLTSLWERLCLEVEAEIQEGVRKKLNLLKDSVNCHQEVDGEINYQNVNYQIKGKQQESYLHFSTEQFNIEQHLLSAPCLPKICVAQQVS